jgi:hypothetical protein
VEREQAIKELGEAPSADSLSTDTAAGVEAGGTVTGGLSPRPRAVTRVVPFGPGGGAESGSRTEKEPLQAVPGRLSVRHLSHGSDSVSDSEGLYSTPATPGSQPLLSHPRC